MKRLLKRALLATYRRTEFARRPFRNELEALFKGCVTSSFEEVRLSLDDLVSEVYRLQCRVDELTDEVASLRAADRREARPAA